jgi:hypothetical protein
VGGGWSNAATLDYATVGGGCVNEASGNHATVGGGERNTASDWYATVGGGQTNTASGSLAMVPGGYGNTASGTFSFAAGCRAKANHQGAFVWADSTTADFASTGNDTFLIRASGGVGIGTNDPGGYQLAVNGDAAKTGGGSWSTLSDGMLKSVIGSYGYGLSEVCRLNPVRYSYKDDNGLSLPAGEEFVGLVAQDVLGVIPEAVEENADGYMMLNNDPILWAMLNAIKEQQAVIDDLLRRIEALEGAGK